MVLRLPMFALVQALVFPVHPLQIKFLACTYCTSRLQPFCTNEIAFIIMLIHNITGFVYEGEKAETNSATFDSHSLVIKLRAKL